MECSFDVVLVDVIFYFATLLFNPVFLGSLHTPLCCVISVLSSTSVVLLSFFSCLRLSHISSKSPVTQGLFFLQCFPRVLLAVSVTAVLKLCVIVSTSASAKISGKNVPPINALNSSVMLGSLSFSRSNFILGFYSLPIFFSRTFITSWSLPTSAPSMLTLPRIFEVVVLPVVNLSCPPW